MDVISQMSSLQRVSVWFVVIVSCLISVSFWRDFVVCFCRDCFLNLKCQICCYFLLPVLISSVSCLTVKVQFFLVSCPVLRFLPCDHLHVFHLCPGIRPALMCPIISYQLVNLRSYAPLVTASHVPLVPFLPACPCEFLVFFEFGLFPCVLDIDLFILI